MLRQAVTLLAVTLCMGGVLAMDFGFGHHKHIAEPPPQAAADRLDSPTTAQGVATERKPAELADSQDAGQQQQEEGDDEWDSYWDDRPWEKDTMAAAADSAPAAAAAAQSAPAAAAPASAAAPGAAAAGSAPPAEVLESYDDTEDSAATVVPLTAEDVSRGPGGAVSTQDMAGVLDSVIAEAARDMFGGPQRTLPEPVHALCKDMLTAPSMPQLLGLMDAGFELPSAAVGPSFSLLPFRLPSLLPFPFPSMTEPEGDGGVVVVSASSGPEDPVQWQEVIIESGDRGNNTPPFVTDMLQAFEQQLAGSRLSRKMSAEPQLESGELLKLVVSAGRRLQDVQALPAASTVQSSA